MARPVGFAGNRVCASGFALGLVLLVGAGVILVSHEDAAVAEAPMPESRRLASTGFIKDLYDRLRNHIKHHTRHDVGDWLVPVGTSTPAAGLGLNLIGLIFALFYWIMVVSKVPTIPEQPDKHDDDFRPGLFECCTDIHECLHALCCSTCRNAHTYHVAGIMHYCPALCLQLIILNFCSCCCVPCIFFAYMRIELKHHLGLEANPLMDCLSVVFCNPCTVGQQALAVDELSGVNVQCCCRVRRAHAPVYEQRPLMGPQGPSFR